MINFRLRRYWWNLGTPNVSARAGFFFNLRVISLGAGESVRGKSDWLFVPPWQDMGDHRTYSVAEASAAILSGNAGL